MSALFYLRNMVWLRQIQEQVDLATFIAQRDGANFVMFR